MAKIPIRNLKQCYTAVHAITDIPSPTRDIDLSMEHHSVQSQLEKLTLDFSGKSYIFLTTVSTTLTSLVLPFSMMIFFDRIIPNNSMDSLAFIFIIILLSIILDNILKSYESAYIDKHAEVKGDFLINDLYQFLLKASLRNYHKEKYGVYLEDISTIEMAKKNLLTEGIKQIANLSALCFIWLVIAMIHMQTGIIIAIGGATAFLIAHIYRFKQAYLAEEKSRLEAATNTSVIEMISNAHSMKCTNMEFRIENYLSPTITARELITSAYESNSTQINERTTIINQVILFIVVFSCASSVINNDINQGVMAAIILLVNRFNSQLQTVIGAHQMHIITNAARHSLERLLTLKEQEDTQSEIDKINSIELLGKPLTPGVLYLLKGCNASGKSFLLSLFSKRVIDNEFPLYINQKSI